MRLQWFGVAAFFGMVALGGAPAQAGLDGSTVQTAVFLEVPFPPPPAPALPAVQDCTVIMCDVPNYPVPPPGSSQNFPAPTAPVNYVEDGISLTTISVADATIRIENNFSGLFCPLAGCTPGYFGGYVFTFTNLAHDITGVTDSYTGNFAPVPINPGLPTGLAWTGNTITVNAAGDNLALGDTLTLNVKFGVTSTVPEPSTWAMMLLGFAGLGFAASRRARAAPQIV